MRTRKNNFVKFMRRVHPLNHSDNLIKKDFNWKAPWPGNFNLEPFLKLVTRITEEYSVGESLSAPDQNLLDRAITWWTTDIEDHLADIYSSEPICPEVMTHFANWKWRLENGETPNREEHTAESSPF